MSDGIGLFSSLAEDYARYRPGYPADVLDELARVCGLTPDWKVADIGSGTGNLARLFLEAGHRVIGVEPNREMREWAERQLSGYKAFHSLDGTAEDIPIEPGSIDLVAVGQALHWFDVDRTRAEFRRILRPGGWVAVMWNDPVPDADEFSREYRALCSKQARTQLASEQPPSLDNGVDRFFGNRIPHTACFPHAMRYDLEGFLGRVRSSGHLPQPGAPGYEEPAALLTDLFTRHQCGGLVEFQYVTQIYVGCLPDCS